MSTVALRPVRPATGRTRGQSNNSSQEVVKVLYRVTEAMAMLSMSRAVFYEQIRTGRLRSVKVGRSRRVPATAITEFLELLEHETGVEA